MEDLIMKKVYMMPTMNVEQAQPTYIIAVSFNGGDTGLSGSEGSDGEAHTKEDNWDIWGGE